jgi:competence protein ComEA
MPVATLNGDPMSRRFLHWFAAAAFAAAYGHAFAAVDVNAADEAALLGIKGIGPAKARAILDERAAGGPFTNAADLAQRVKGLGGQTLKRLRAEGLEIGAPVEYVPAQRLVAARIVPGAPTRAAAVALYRTEVSAKAQTWDRRPDSTSRSQAMRP